MSLRAGEATVQPGLALSIALVALTRGWIVLHEGHGHETSSSGGLEGTTVAGALVFLAVVAAGTWYVYENYGA